jgi:exonuclease III
MNYNISGAFDLALFKDQDVSVANIDASCDGQMVANAEVESSILDDSPISRHSHQLVRSSVVRYQPLVMDVANGVQPGPLIAGGLADYHPSMNLRQRRNHLEGASPNQVNQALCPVVSMVAGQLVQVDRTHISSAVDTSSDQTVEAAACVGVNDDVVVCIDSNPDDGWTVVGSRRRAPAWRKRTDDLDGRSLLLWGVGPAVTCLAIHQLIIRANLGRFILRVELLKIAINRCVRIVCHTSSSRDVLYILFSPIVAGYRWRLVRSWTYQLRQQARIAKQPVQQPSTVPSSSSVVSSSVSHPRSVSAPRISSTGTYASNKYASCASRLHQHSQNPGMAPSRSRSMPSSLSDLASINRYQILQPTEKLVLGNFNCNRGLFRNKEEIGFHLRQSVKADMVAISESGLKGKLSIVVPGYEWYGHNSQDSNYGGVGMLVRRHLVPYVSVLSFDLNQYWISVSSSEQGRRPLAICSVYMPPSTHSLQVRQSVYGSLSARVRQYQSKYDVVLMGDFNARVGKPITPSEHTYIGQYGESVQRNSNGKFFMDLLVANNLVSMNARCGRSTQGGQKVPYTRVEVVKNERSIIDYVCVSSSLVKLCSSHVIDDVQVGSSDHKLNYLSVHGFSKVKAPKLVRVERFRVEKLAQGKGVPAYQQQIQDRLSSWLPSSVSSSSQDSPQVVVDKVWQFWSDAVLSAATESVGKKIIVKGRSRPEIDSAVLSLIRQRRQLYRQFATSQAGSARSQLWVQYIALRKQVHQVIRDKKASKWSQLMDQLESEYVDRGNMKQFWSSINRIASSRARQVSSIGPIIDPDSQKLVIDQPAIRSVFASYFHQLGADSPQDAKFDQVFKDQIDTVINNQPIVSPVDDEDSISHECPFTLDDVCFVLDNLKNGKSCGPDGIPNELLKYGGEYLQQSYFRLLQFCYRRSCLPSPWDRSRIVVLPKPGDLKLCSNYRGISLMVSSAKVHAKLVGTSVINKLQLAEGQAGFRSEYRGMDHVFVLYETLRARKLAGKHSYCFFIDVKKAFDMVWRNGLWFQLQQYGIDAKLWQMLRVMYRKVESCVVIDGEDSLYFVLEKGVRQGCTASPPLFIIFFNELCKELNASGLGIGIVGAVISALLFADDIVLISDSQTGLQQMMNIVHAFFHKWRLEENLAKSHVLQVCGNSKQLRSFNYQFNGKVVDIVHEYRYLGVLIHDTLSWDRHVEVLVNKVKLAQQQISHVLANRKLSIRIRRYYWLSVIRPILDYGSEVVRLPVTLYDRLDTVQNIGMSIILGCNVHTNTWAMRAELGMHSIRSRYDQAQLIYYHRFSSLASSRFAKQVFQAQTAQQQHTFKQHIQHLAKQYKLSLQVEDVDGLSLEEWATRVKDKIAVHQATLFQAAASQSSRMSILGSIKQQFRQVSQESQEVSFVSPICLEKWLQDGRSKSSRLKVKFRLGTTSLHSDLVKIKSKSGSRVQVDSNVCKVCSTQRVENRPHFLLHCPAYNVLRQSFFSRLAQIDSELGGKFGQPGQDAVVSNVVSDDKQVALLLSLDQASHHSQVATLFNQYLCQAWLTRSSMLSKLARLSANPPVNAPQVLGIPADQLSQLAIQCQSMALREGQVVAQAPLPLLTSAAERGRPNAPSIVDFQLAQDFTSRMAIRNRIGSRNSQSIGASVPSSQASVQILSHAVSQILPANDMSSQILPAAVSDASVAIDADVLLVGHVHDAPAHGQSFDSRSNLPCAQQVGSMALSLRQ